MVFQHNSKGYYYYYAIRMGSMVFQYYSGSEHYTKGIFYYPVRVGSMVIKYDT